MNFTYKELAMLNKIIILSVSSSELRTHDCIKEIHLKISEAIINGLEEGEDMNFTYKELALLNKMMGIAFRSGEIEFDEVSKSVHEKVADEIVKRNSPMEKSLLITSA